MSELAGIYGITKRVQMLEKIDNLKYGGIGIGCDGLSALGHVFLVDTEYVTCK